MLELAQLVSAFPAQVDTAFAPIYGYYVATSPEPVVVRIDGEALDVSITDRTDLAKVYPDRVCRGFHAIFESPGTPGPAAELVIHVGGTEIMRQRFATSALAHESAARSAAARTRNRDFVLKHLACSVCGASLGGDAQPDRCPSCHTRFDVSTRAISAVPAGSYAIPRAANTSFCHYDAQEHALIETVRGTAGRILDFGAGLRPDVSDGLIAIEIADMPSIDVVSVSDRLPFQDATFDGVITLHVLEHLERPWAVARELIRVTKPGGTILATVPYVCPVHGFPHHFFSMTPSGLRSLFHGCDVVSHTMKPDAHPINGIKQLLSTFGGAIHDPAVRRAFGRVTLDEIIEGDLGGLIQADWARALNEAAKWEMPAHSTLVVRTPG